MSEDRFDPQKIRTECGKVDAGEYHVYPDICKCKYDEGREANDITVKALKGEVDNRIQLEKSHRRINELAILLISTISEHTIDCHQCKNLAIEIKELSK